MEEKLKNNFVLIERCGGEAEEMRKDEKLFKRINIGKQMKIRRQS